jgi:hypothetical protein
MFRVHFVELSCGVVITAHNSAKSALEQRDNSTGRTAPPTHM